MRELIGSVTASSPLLLAFGTLSLLLYFQLPSTFFPSKGRSITTLGTRWHDFFIFFLLLFLDLSIYIPWPFPPVWGVADNTKKQQKQWGFHSVLLATMRDPAEFGWHCWSNTAHPPPSSTTYVASYMPSPLLPLPQGCLYKATQWQQQMPIRTASQSFATHSYP